MAKNKFITNSSNTSASNPNITARKAFKISNITHTTTYCQLTLSTPIDNTELSTAITTDTHTITIRANGFYAGIENCQFTKVSNDVFNVSSNGQNPFPTSLAYQNSDDNTLTGNIRNILIFDDHPDWGETELDYFNFASGIQNQCGTRNTVSFGQENQSIGEDSICVGYRNKTGYFCGAFGQQNKVLGHSSYGFGRENTIIADPLKESMFAFGSANVINASNGVAIGNSNKIHEKAFSSICVGSRNHTHGNNSFAGGSSCMTYGRNSFAYGQGLQTKGAHTILFGKWATINDDVENNATNGIGRIAFAIGNGSYDDATQTATRSNAFSVDWHGGTVSGKNCVGHAYGYKINAVSDILTREELTDAGITPVNGVNYGYYELNSYDASDKKDILEGQEYSVALKSHKICAGKIVKIVNQKVYVDNFPSIPLSTDEDVPENGDINNYLMITNYPQYGDTFIGYFTSASGQNCYAFSRVAEASGRDTRALGKYSHAHGRGTKAGYCATAFGLNSQALGIAATSEGSGTKAIGDYSHSHGSASKALGIASTAMGDTTTASGKCSTAIGQTAIAEGDYSFAGGEGASAEGKSSFSFGYSTKASGKYSVAIGEGARTTTDNTTILGKYNNSIDKNYALVIGNGTSFYSRGDALTLDWDGNLELGGQTISLKSPDGTNFKIKVSNDGTLITEKVVD